MKFVWYIINNEDGTITGTNDTDAARKLVIEGEGTYTLLHQNGTAFHYEDDEDLFQDDVEEHEFDEADDDDEGDDD